VPARPGASTGPSGLSGNLTAAGAVIGTPSYMAPEQIDGEVVDERSDQYAWCIALWEALYGAQPFVSGNLAVRSAAMKTDTPRPPAGARVPRALARILLRGLAADPAQRWPTMDALLGALDRATASRRTALGAAMIAAVVIVVAVFAIGQRAGEAEHGCALAGQPAAALWTPALARELARGFAATGAPYAGDAAVSLGRSITSWRARWQRIAVESCAATRVHASQRTSSRRSASSRRGSARSTRTSPTHTMTSAARTTARGSTSSRSPTSSACSRCARRRSGPIIQTSRRAWSTSRSRPRTSAAGT
jgi:hypothetical protein